MSRWKPFIILLLCMFLLEGCNSTDKKQAITNSSVNETANKFFISTKTKNDMKNVEERGYATILLISEGKDGKRYHFDMGIAQEKKVGEESQTEEVSSFDCNSLEELAQEYQIVKGKDLSLAHLKVILFGQNGTLQSNGQMFTQKTKTSFMNRGIYNLEGMQELLQDLDENEEIAKTCPVLQLTEQQEFLEYLEKAEEPVGTYISNLVEAGERQGKDIPWLKDYLKAVKEGDMLLTYALEPVSQGWKLRCSNKIEGTKEEEPWD